MPITHLRGDATQPTLRPAIIAHVCNDVGAWGAGFVLAISKRWPEPETAFRKASRWRLLHLGDEQVVRVEPNLWVFNMIAQHGLRSKSNPTPIQYDALETCLRRLANNAYELEASVHMPRIGCGLAGGHWPTIEALIEKHLGDLDVYIYTL